MTIFESKDFRTYLRHYLLQLPKRGRGELSKIANHLNVSTTLISQIVAGKKVLTPEQSQNMIQYLGLTGLEADYLNFLNQWERAGSSDLKKYWKTKLNQIREQSLKVADRLKTERTLNDHERSVFYSSPIYSSVRLYTSVGTHGKSLGDICSRFEIPPAKAQEILKFLVETGLCDFQNDRYFMGPQSTHLEKGSPHWLRHHSNWRTRAILRSESLSDEELMYTVGVSLSEKDFTLLREAMVNFIKKFLETVHQSPAEDIACLNLDFFWIQR